MVKENVTGDLCIASKATLASKMTLDKVSKKEGGGGSRKTRKAQTHNPPVSNLISFSWQPARLNLANATSHIRFAARTLLNISRGGLCEPLQYLPSELAPHS